MSEIRNAIVESSRIEIEDHGMLTVWLFMDYGDSGHQGFGGYALYLPSDFKHHSKTSHAGHWIFRCLEMCGVTDWSQVRGKTVRCRIEQGKIEAIGHIVENKWFCPEEELTSQEVEVS